MPVSAILTLLPGRFLVVIPVSGSGDPRDKFRLKGNRTHGLSVCNTVTQPTKKIPHECLKINMPIGYRKGRIIKSRRMR
jgi:hypothetical protein